MVELLYPQSNTIGFAQSTTCSAGIPYLSLERRLDHHFQSLLNRILRPPARPRMIKHACIC